MEIAGLDAKIAASTGASLLQKPNLHGHSVPGTLWATNYSKFAINHMFTLFWAGEVLADRCLYKGENVGSFMQRHYIEAFVSLAKCLVENKVKSVVGFDIMNEPHPGWLEVSDIEKPWNEDIFLHLESMPTVWQSMVAAAGMPVEGVAFYTKSFPVPTKKTSVVTLNEHGKSCWLEDCQDVWRQHGVWNLDSNNEPILKDHHYFSRFPKTHPQKAGKDISFNNDFYIPFLLEFRKAIKQIMPMSFFFIEPVPNTSDENFMNVFNGSQDICYAPHFYDLKALFEKKWTSTWTVNVQALSSGSRRLWNHV